MLFSLFCRRKPQRRSSARVAKRHSAEQLEIRSLLTGNIAVSLRSGALTIVGDVQDNQIEVTQPTPGTIRVQGLDGTTVNGRAASVTTGVRHMTFQMTQGGADQVAMQGPVSIAGNLRATLGDGDFNLEGSGGPIEIGRDLFVVAGSQGNVSLLNNVTVRGTTNIRSGGNAVASAGLATLPNFAAAVFSDPLTIDNPYFPFVPG